MAKKYKTPAPAETESKTVKLRDGLITLSAKGYLHLNEKFADLTTVDIREALIVLNAFFKTL